MRPVLLVVGGWLLAAGVAAVLGVLAVYLLGSGIVAGTGKVLGADDVQRELARSGSPGTTGPPAAPSSPLAPPSSTEPPASGDDSNSDTDTDTDTDEPNGGQLDARLQTVDTPGGTIIARCRGAKTELVSWTPRQGFEADDEVSDPEGAVYLEFSGSDVKVHVALGCSEGTLVPLVVTGED